MLRNLSRSLIRAQTSQAATCNFSPQAVAAPGALQSAAASSSPSGPSQSASVVQTPATSSAATAVAANSASSGSARSSGASWSDVPPPAKLLGLAGVIPFIALSPPIAASLPLLPAELVQNAALLQVAYGASICSFLGGIHWAMAMAEYGGRQAALQMGADRYVWSVTPCLMAWPAVVMAPGPASLAIASVLAVVHAVDGRFAGQKLLPQWYMVLRRPLSAFAISGMLVTLFGSFLYPQTPQRQTGTKSIRQQELA